MPVITTPCPAFLEVGVKDGENAFVVDYDMNNVNVSDIYEKRLKFNFEAKKDGWRNILIKGKSNYKEEMKMKVKVKCKSVLGYDDMLLKRHIKYEEEFVPCVSCSIW